MGRGDELQGERDGDWGGNDGYIVKGGKGRQTVKSLRGKMVLFVGMNIQL